METAIVIILYLCIFIFDLMPIIKNKEKKVYWVYLVFFMVSFCVLILYTLHIEVPSPSILIKQIVLKIFPNLK